MNILDIIYVPFGFIIRTFYNISQNYALTLFCFAVIVKMAMLPLTIKQQKGMIKQTQLRPKEQAIRKKYAGRNDAATQQKMQTELMDMYKANNYSPMGGCLPLLIQFPVIIALYQIVREPLHYIAEFSTELILKIKTVAFTLFGEVPEYADTIFRSITAENTKNITEINLIKIMHDPGNLSRIIEDVPEIANFKNINMIVFGDLNLADTPAALGISLLLLIPVLNFILQFVQTRVTKKLNAGTQTAEIADNKGMKVMENVMPLMMVYIAYTFPAALGLYWVFQGIIQLGQSIVIAKIYPIPKISEEEYKNAAKEYGVKELKEPKKKTRRPYQDDDEDEESAEENEDLSDTREGEIVKNSSSNDDSGDNKEKYISDNIPKGISPTVKSNYKKTGQKYNIKKKK